MPGQDFQYNNPDQAKLYAMEKTLQQIQQTLAAQKNLVGDGQKAAAVQPTPPGGKAYTASTRPTEGERECPNCKLMHADPKRIFCRNRACKAKLPPPMTEESKEPTSASPAPSKDTDKKTVHLDSVLNSIGRPKKSLGAVSEWPELPTQEEFKKKAEEKVTKATPTMQSPPSSTQPSDVRPNPSPDAGTEPTSSLTDENTALKEAEAKVKRWEAKLVDLSTANWTEEELKPFRESLAAAKQRVLELKPKTAHLEHTLADCQREIAKEATRFRAKNAELGEADAKLQAEISNFSKNERRSGRLWR